MIIIIIIIIIIINKDTLKAWKSNTLIYTTLGKLVYLFQIYTYPVDTRRRNDVVM